MNLTWAEASAGSGKTTFLINQIKHYSQVFSCDEIMCLTFSKAAASEIKDRADSEINSLTLHSLAHQIIKNEFNDKEITTKNFFQISLLEALKVKEINEIMVWLIEEGFDLNNDVYQALKKEKKEENILYEVSQELDENIEKLILETGIEELKSIIKKLAKKEVFKKEEFQKIKINFFTKEETLRKKFKIKIESEKLKNWILNRIEEHEKLRLSYKNYGKKIIVENVLNIENKIKEEKKLLYYSDLIDQAKVIIKDEINSGIFLNTFGKIKVIIVDEAQDLSTQQWEFLYQILETWQLIGRELIFASDEKQLIYEFQGANLIDFKKYQYKISKLCEKVEIKKLNITYRLPKKICEILDNLNSFLEEMSYGKHTSFKEEDGVVNVLNIESNNDLVRHIKSINSDQKEIMILFKQRSDRMIDLGTKLMQEGYILNSDLMLNHPFIKDFKYLIHYVIFQDNFSKQIVLNLFENNEKAGLEFLKKMNKKEKLTNLNFLFLEWVENDFLNKFWAKHLNENVVFFKELLMHYANYYKHQAYEAINDSNMFFKEHQTLFKNGMILNTIHSVKGKEADHVILCDTDFKSKFKNDTERLLYVGLTRTKKTLTFPILNEKIEKTWFEKIEKVI